MNTLEINKFLFPKNYVILWENINTGASFPAQIITVQNIEKYKFIEIYFVGSPMIKCLVGTGTMSSIRTQDTNGNWTGAWHLDIRGVSVASDGKISFTDNRGSSTNVTNGYSIRNQFNIPSLILGYKY